MNSDLRRLPFLVRISRMARDVINQNFLFGVLFVVVVLSAGALGYVHPIVAALLHNAGALIVVFNSARLVRQGEELEPMLQAATEAPADSGTGGGDASNTGGRTLIAQPV
jgi:Cd2+/Zn2+-exporting ATPase